MRPTTGRNRQYRIVGAAMLTVFIPGAAAARDQIPFPQPLRCPLDVPVRVGDDSTLSRYAALSACDAELIVVAPPVQPLAARYPVTVVPEAPAKTRRNGRTGQRGEPKIGDTRVEQAALGSAGVRVVRIIPTLPPEPSPDASDELATIAAATSLPVTAGLSDEAILALRPAAPATPYDSMIADAAVRHRIDPLMLHSVIMGESSYRPAVVSAAGARGLMQIMPATGAGLGVAPARLFEPAANVDTGARLLRGLWGRMHGRLDLVLAAYHAGEGAVRRYGMAVPPFAATQGYVAKVQGLYRGLIGANRLRSASDVGAN